MAAPAITSVTVATFAVPEALDAINAQLTEKNARISVLRGPTGFNGAIDASYRELLTAVDAYARAVIASSGYTAFKASSESAKTKAQVESILSNRRADVHSVDNVLSAVIPLDGVKEYAEGEMPEAYKGYTAEEWAALLPLKATVVEKQAAKAGLETELSTLTREVEILATAKSRKEAEVATAGYAAGVGSLVGSALSRVPLIGRLFA